MADKRWKVRVGVRVPGAQSSTPDEASDFNLVAPHADRAARLARERLEARGLRVLSLSHAPERRIIVVVEATAQPQARRGRS